MQNDKGYLLELKAIGGGVVYPSWVDIPKSNLKSGN